MEYIYESPDGGKTVTRRPFNGDIEDREIILQPSNEEVIIQQAQDIVFGYKKEAIELAYNIINEPKNNTI